MKKNPLSPEEFSALAHAIAELPFVKPQRAKADYILDLMETVINFHIRVEVVLSSLGYFRETVQHQHPISSHNDLKAVLARFTDDEAGNKACSQYLWGNLMWTRIGLLRKLITFFESVGVNDQNSLHDWANQANFEGSFRGRVKGLGIAVFHWLQIRCNVDSVKPDVHVLNFGKRVIGRRVSEKVLVDAISQIAPLVGQSMAAVDVTIWFWGRLGMADDRSGLRLIAWKMLKAGLEERLREEVLQDFNWRLILDSPEKLRFGEAGLTILPDRSLFGEMVPGETTVTLRQSAWNDGLTLEMLVQHDTELPLPLFNKLQENLAEQHWEASNDPHFRACLDMDEDMMMSPNMNIDELAIWIEKIVLKLFEDAAICCGNQHELLTAETKN